MITLSYFFLFNRFLPPFMATEKRIGRSPEKKCDLSKQIPVTTNSDPLLTSRFENHFTGDEQTTQKSSILPHEMVKVKSIAAGHISREIKRHPVPEKPHTDEVKEGESKVGTSKDCLNTNEEDDDKITVFPCLPAVSISMPELDEGGVVAFFRFFVDWLLFIISFPFVCLFTWTIPDCSKPHTRKYFLISFFASTTWIAILSFGMVTIVGRAGCILNIDKFTMGLVVVAIGTSIPVSCTQ